MNIRCLHLHVYMYKDHSYSPHYICIKHYLCVFSKPKQGTQVIVTLKWYVITEDECAVCKFYIFVMESIVQ